MKTLRKLFSLFIVFVMLLGVLPTPVIAEGENEVPNGQEFYETGNTEAEGNDMEAAIKAAEEEAARQAAEQQAALEAAAEEAARKAQEEAAKQQAELDKASEPVNEVWEKVDEIVAPQEEVVEQTQPVVEEVPTEVKEEVQEIEEEKETSKKELSALIDLGDGSSITVVVPSGAVSETTKLVVNELSGAATSEYAKTLGVDNVYDGRSFTLVLSDEEGNEVNPIDTPKISFNKIKVNGELVSIYGITDGSHEAYVEGMNNNVNGIDYSFDSKGYKTFVILTTNPEEEVVEVTEVVKNTKRFNTVLSASKFLPDAVKKSKMNSIVDVNLNDRQESTFTSDLTATETNYPAFRTTQNVSGTNMQVIVDAPEGAFPEGIQLFAGVVSTPKEVLDVIGDVENSDVLSIDVHFYLPEDPNTEIEPATPINVTFNNINLNAETVDVYHETEKIAEVNGEGGTLALDDFSTYTFVASEGNGFSQTGAYEAKNIVVKPGDSGTAKPIITENGTAVTNFTGWTFESSNPSVVTIEADGAISPAKPGTATITATTPNNERLSFIVDAYALVKYDANGGTGTVADTEYGGSNPSAIAANGSGFTKAGYSFLGWSETANPSVADKDYDAGADLSSSGFFSSLGADANSWVKPLYAVWTPVITFNVTKVWDDDNNRDGVRPASVDIELYLSRDGGNTWRQYSNTASLNDNNSWAHRFVPVPAIAQNGTPLAWKVVEATAMSDYSTSANGTAGTNEVVFTVDQIADIIANNGGVADVKFTNNHEPETVSVSVTKVWYDDSNRDGKRPASITGHLVGKVGDQTVVTRDFDWGGNTNWEQYTTTLTKDAPTDGNPLYKNYNGQPIVYTVTEDAVTDYTTEITGDAETGFTVTNTHVPETINVTVNKVWDDKDNVDNTRTAVDFTLIGKAGDRVVSNVTKTLALGETSVNFGTKKKYFEQQEIKWTLEEVAIENYETEITVEDNAEAKTKTFTVTNKYIPETTEITIVKEWDDNDNSDRARPTSVRVRLMNNGTEVANANLMEADDWTKTFTVRTKDASGNLIEYNVDEDPVPNYLSTPEITVEGDLLNGFTYTVKNVYEYQKINVTAEKVWDDADNQDGVRPDTVTLTLTGSDGSTNTLTQSADETTFDFGELPAYLDGKKIEYTLTEDAVDGYTTEITGDAETGFTVTNSHTPATFDLSVMKTWAGDENNRDNTRKAVQVKVYSNVNDGGPGKPTTDKLVATVDVDLTPNSDETFEVAHLEDLPVYEGGEPLFYWVDEGDYEADPTEIVEGYTVSADLGFGPNGLIMPLYPNTFKITPDDIAADGILMVGFINTYDGKTEELSIPVTKVWDDDRNRDGIRPAAIQGHLKGYVDGSVVVERDFDWGGNTTWTNKTTRLSKDNDGNPLYKNYEGKEIEYVVTEDSYDGYTTEITGNATDGFTVTNKHTPETLRFYVEKEWDDADNQDGIRPTEVEITIKGNDAVVDTITLTEDDYWYDRFGPYFVYENGAEIDYTVEETETEVINGDADTGYAPEVTGDKVEGFVITNKHNPKTITVTAEKVWDDDNNRDKKRPEKITLHLLANGENVKSVSTDQTTYEFTNLPFYDNGKEINYVVVEGQVADYTTTYEKGEADNDGNFAWTITNKYVPETTTITATKVWDDADNQEGLRPENVTLTLQYNNTNQGWIDMPASSMVSGEVNQVVSEDNFWMATWTVKTNSKTGKPLEFQVVEKEVPAEYEVKYANNGGVWTVKNTHKPAVGDLKVWKVWEDDSDRDGLRPTTIDVYVTENGTRLNDKVVSLNGTGASWQYTFKDLPLYKEGELIKYGFQEVVPEGYTVEYGAEQTLTEGGSKTIKVTNTHKPETITTKITKVWDDNDDQDGLRVNPQFKLVGYNTINGGAIAGVERNIDFNKGATEALTVTKDDSGNVFYKNYKGKPINYVLTEEAIEGYTTTIEGSMEEGFTVTNTHEPATGKFTIIKLWEDADDQDGLRPDSIRVTAINDDASFVKVYTITKESGWTLTTEELPVYRDGNQIEYTFFEQIPEGYEETIYQGESVRKLEPGAEYYVLFDNEHVPETTTVHVDKTWDDENNHDHKRPDEIIYTLYADGVAVRSQAVHEAEDWKFDFGGDADTAGTLPKYADGKEIAYDVVESPVADYTTVKDTKVNAAGEQTVSFTNTYKPGMTTITAIKEWDDADDQDGLRPTEVEVELQWRAPADSDAANFKSFGEKKTLTLNEANTWTGSWDVYTKRQKTGSDMEYQVVEPNVPEGYEAKVSQFDGAWTVKNTHVPAVGSLQIKKVWDDDSNRDGLRPTNLNVYVTANGARVPGLEKNIVGSGVNWWYKFENLPLYEDGELIEYAFEEDIPEGYTPTYGDAVTLVEGKNKVIEVTNTHKPETITTKITKVWDDNDDQDVLRVNPQFKLVGYNTINGGAIAGVERNIDFNKGATEALTVTKDDSGNVFYKNYKGKPINYVLTEEAIEGYTTTIEGSMEEGFTVTNTHEPKTADIKVYKTWEDDDDRDGIRPDSLRVIVQGGTDKLVYADAFVLTATDGWIYTVEDVPLYDEGKPVTYHFMEEPIEGYTEGGSQAPTPIVRPHEVTPAADEEAPLYIVGFTNVHEPELTKVNVTKTWDDESNHDKKRPAEIQYTLFGNGISLETVTVSGNNKTDADWGYTFNNLFMYENGEKIVYTVTEHAIADYTTTTDTTANAEGETVVEFTNTYKPGMTTITAVKEWDDADDQDGLRPTEVEVELQWKVPADGYDNFSSYKEKKLLTLNEANTWTGSWDVYTQREATGSDIEFRVVEPTVPEGYEVSISELDGVWTVKNTHEPAVGELKAVKNWDDDSNRDGLRPASLDVYVTADGERLTDKVGTLTGKGNTWEYTFKDLPVYKNGEPVEYGLEEVVPEGYTVEYGDAVTFVDEATKTVEITNTHKPEKMQFTIKKIWDDNDNQDGKRVPIVININGYVDGKIAPVASRTNYKVSTGRSAETVTKPLQFSKDDNGDPFYKYYEGKEIRYEVTEDAVPEYTTTITGSAAEGFVITNTHEPKTIDVTVNKTWFDYDNQDGIRPDYLSIKLMADGEEVASERISATDNWKKVFEGLPAFKEGKAIVYTVEEEVPVDYDQTAGDTENDKVTKESGSITLENTHEPETTEVKVVKHWDDENNHDKVRPESIDITLFADSIPAKTFTLKGNATTDEDWTVTFVELDKYKNGKEIVYTVSENSIPNYTMASMDNKIEDVTEEVEGETVVTGTINTFEITNKYEPGMTTITVNKVWDDADNQDGVRPTSVSVDVLTEDDSKAQIKGANGPEDAPTATLSEANNWQASWDVYTKDPESGEELTFHVVEDTSDTAVFGDDLYSVTYAETKGVFTVKNSYTPKVSDIKVEKYWDDRADQDGIRPDSIIFKLMANGKLVADRELELSASDADPDNPHLWIGVFKDLPVFENGKEIEYSVEESIIDGYTPQIGYVGANHPHTHQERRPQVEWITIFGVRIPVIAWRDVDVVDGPPVFSVVNTHEPETTSVSADKVWNDADDQDGIRSDAASALGMVVKTYVDGEELAFATVLEGTGYDQDAINIHTEPKMLFTSDQSSYGWSGIPKYYQGKEITYKVVEEVNPKGEATPEQIEAAEKYTANTTETAPNVYEITNTYTPKTINVTVNKTWDDANNIDGVRPEYLAIELKAGDEVVAAERLGANNNWSTVFTELPAYKEGTAIVYTVEETLPEGYEQTKGNTEADVVTEESGTIALENKHTPETTEVWVYKEWNDDEDRDGERPETLRITLLADGSEYAAETLNMADFENVEIEGYPGAFCVFSELPKYNDGKKINYTVIEESVENYTSKINALTVQEMELGDSNLVLSETDFGNVMVFRILNTHVPGVKDVTVAKTWVDEDDADGIRPTSVEVKLLADGEETGDTATLSEDTGWVYTFKEVPVKKDGKEIAYTVEESEAGVINGDATTGYKATYVNDGGEGGYFTIVNTHEVKRVSHTVTINWDDNNNQDGTRPDFVRVQLMKDGEVVEGSAVVLSAANGWTHTWEDLPAGEYTTVTDPNSQTDAAYSSDEVTPLDNPDYTKVSAVTEGGTTTITNKYEPQTFEIEGHKIWVDNNNQDGKRPESITINLYADGEKVDSTTINASNASATSANIWTYSFKDLPRYRNGNVIRYTVAEEALENYTISVHGYDIYNTYTPGKTFLTVIKLWDDDRDRDGLRPDNVIVRLLANGEEVNRASLSAGSGWFTVFTGIDMMKDGKEVEYTVVEDAVDGYESSTSGDQKSGFVLTNKHTPETRSITINKVWMDDNNAKGERPSAITVNVLVNGMVVDSRILTEADGWTTTIDGLPKNANGHEIAYTIAENPVKNYQPTVVGFTITNKYCEDCCCPVGCDTCPPNGDGKVSPSNDKGNDKKAIPDTSDNSNISLYGSIYGISCLIAIMALILKKKYAR